MIALEHQLGIEASHRLRNGGALEHQHGRGAPSVAIRRGIESRMQAKQSGMEDSILLGHYVPLVGDEFDLSAGYPVPFPNAWGKSHLLLCGATRSGKSALLHAFAASKIRQGTGPCVIGDMKGDDVMFHGLRLVAEEEGRPFKWFTNVPYFSTYIFNPWDQEGLKNLPLHQFVQVNICALDLWFGHDYGRGHYSAQSRGALMEVFSFQPSLDARGRRTWAATEETKKITSFAQAFERLKAVKDRPEFREATQLLMVLQDLANMMQINFEHQGKPLPKAAIDGAIKIADLLTPDPTTGKYAVIYLYLRAGTEIVGVSQVMKLFLYSLYIALVQAKDFYKLGRTKVAPPDECWVAIDEFQHMADDSIRPILEQCASSGLNLCLANQDLSQLKRGNVDLAQSVFENAGSKVFFTCRDFDLQDRLIKLSGERIVHIPSYSVSHDAFRAGNVEPENALAALNGDWTPITITEQRAPRFDRNTLIRVSNHPGRCIFVPPQAASGVNWDGFPIILDCPFHISEEEFKRLDSLPWPSNKHTIVAEELGGSGGSGPVGRAAPKKPTSPKPTKPRKRIVEAEPKGAAKKPTNGKAQNNGKDES